MGIITISYAVSIILIVAGIIFKKKSKNKAGNIMLVVGIILFMLSLIPGVFVIFYLLNATTS